MEAEPDAENIEADLAPSELIDQYENTDWSEIPGVSAAEAGTWTARLIEAQEAVQEGLSGSSHSNTRIYLLIVSL